MRNIFEVGENCWDTPKANRFGMMIDGANYYAALRESMLKAENAIFVVGWDIDSRIRLASEEDPDDGAPIKLRDFLCFLVEKRPSLKIYVLMWDFSILYALEREPLPALNLVWSTPKNVEVCLDDIVPLGASQHQKIVVIDGKIAYCGGLDLASQRWDTREHKVEDPLRVNASGEMYRPFHDLHAVVDGDAAKVLTDLVMERWENAACSKPDIGESEGDPWPESVEPSFKNIEVAVARTIAPLNQRPGVYEVERLYVDMIACAKHTIYIENQFLTAMVIAEALAEALKREPELEVILVSSRDPHGFLEAQSMQSGRARFMSSLAEDDEAFSRVRLAHPCIESGQEVLVHAKLMIIDDCLLRVGSSNLNNRSMGTDGECDIVVRAEKDEERAEIIRIRNDLLAEHLNLSLEETEAGIEEHGSIRALIDSKQGEPRTLKETNYEVVVVESFSNALNAVADPERPGEVSQFVGDMLSARPVGPTLSGKVLIGIGLAVIAVLISVWQFSPLADFTDPQELKSVLNGLRGDPWAYLIVPLAFVVGSMLVFPITAMIAATAVVFPPTSAFFIALAGAIMGSLANYFVGHSMGRSILRRMMGKRLNKISRALAKQGILTVITMRVVPIAPFTLINLVAGASHIKFLDFFVGTLIGLLPGIATMTFVGHRLFALLEDPDAMDIGLLFLALAVWFGVGFLAQKALKRAQKTGFLQDRE